MTGIHLWLSGENVTIKDVTTETFTVEVLQADRPVLVDFWAPWCGPCKALAPLLAQIAEEHAGTISVVKVDIDDNPEIAADHHVMSIPTMTLFVDGRAATTINGAKSRKAILGSLANWL
ncbi:thioredoxin [Actinophytocola oryzae]|uniref:Thioredoxin n=1 Tax=Actinophytocola oryzae TaxID=502181 RepID=A0A4R7VFN6_9PSEU|nr:thioredoxin [Actinophytocola oryzae]TDV48056.1 thioredoxin [Actinophytocola oryzae]